MNKTKSPKSKSYTPSKKGFGAAMSAISPMQRRYIIELFANPGLSKQGALRLAGYPANNTDHACRKMVQRFMHNQLVIDAIKEYGTEHYIGDLPNVMHRYRDVIDNPKHKDHAKLLTDYMDRVGPRPVQETKIQVTHQFDRDSLISRIALILAQHPDQLKLLDSKPVQDGDTLIKEAPEI